MDPVVTVDNDNVTVEPGGVARVTVRVHNPGTTADGFDLDVLGDAAAWAQLVPAQVQVGAFEAAEVVVYFSPPREIVFSSVPFGVRAVSLVDPRSSAVVEGDLNVGGPPAVSPGAGAAAVATSPVAAAPGPAPPAESRGGASRGVQLVPPTSRGRLAGRHRVEIVNWGNASMHVELEGSDASEALSFRITPDQLDVPIGTTGNVKVRVRPRRRFLSGSPVVHQFRLVNRCRQPTIDGTFEQRGLLGLPMLLGLVAVALVAVGVVWLLGRSSSDTPEATPTPEALTADPISHDLMRLEWETVDGADSYTVVRVDPGAAEAEAEPPTLDVIEDIPGGRGGVDVPDLEAGQDYCFQVSAVRDDRASPRSPAACAQTLELAAAGTPTDVTVERVGEQARVTWVDATAGEAEHVIRRNESAVALVPPGSTELLVDLVDGDNCFEVQARTGGATSEPSTEECLAGPTTPTGPDEDLGIIAVVRSIPIEDPQAEQRAVQIRDELITAGHDAAVLNTADFPALSGPAGNFFWVYIGGFASADEVATYCQTRNLTCVPEEPGPPG